MKKNILLSSLVAISIVPVLTFAAQDWNSSRSNKTSKTQVAPNPAPETTNLILEVSKNGKKTMETYDEMKTASWEDATAQAVKEASKKIDTSSPDLVFGNAMDSKGDKEEAYSMGKLERGKHESTKEEDKEEAYEMKKDADIKAMAEELVNLTARKGRGTPDLVFGNAINSKGDKEEAYEMGRLEKGKPESAKEEDKEEAYIRGDIVKEDKDGDLIINHIELKNDEDSPKFKAGKALRDARSKQDNNPNTEDVIMKIGGNDPIEGIDVIVKRDPSDIAIFDEEGNELDGSISSVIKRTVKEQKNVWAKPSEKELKIVAIKGQDATVKEVKLNDDNTMSIKATQKASLFGFISMDIEVEAKMDIQGVIKEVTTPWYSFLLWGN